MADDTSGEATRAVYEAHAEDWRDARTAWRTDIAERLRTQVGGGLIVDLGCGPGWHMPHLRPALGLDGALAMTRLAADQAAGPVMQADICALPVRNGALAGAWGTRSYVHLNPTALPEALADLHRSLAVGARAVLTLFDLRDVDGASEIATFAREERGAIFDGRWYGFWPEPHLRRVIEGAGFEINDWYRDPTATHVIKLTALRSLPDRVGPDLSLLICGLNPSPASSDSGVGFHKAGNRFWPAALGAGIATVDRDPTHALRHHRVGMTDLVKRTTSKASEVTAAEFAAGIERLDALCGWLEPAAVCMVGLSGWRAGVDRKATVGWQSHRLGGRPVYVMGSTSGLNAHETVDSLTEHFRAAASPPN